jgi:predicted nucleic acid-binding protein
MAKPKILDTNVLIEHFTTLYNTTERDSTAFRNHAEELIEFQGTNQIVSPVLVEFLAGANRENLECRKAYVGVFTVLDKGNIPAKDWEEAKRIAQWVRIGRQRKLGDCLIEAIAKRLNGDIISYDRDIWPRVPPQRAQ